MDYDYVNERLAVGSVPRSVTDLHKLAKDGITHIVTCSTENDLEPLLLIAEPSINYLRNGVSDDRKSKPVRWFQRSIEFSLKALSQPHHKVFYHCERGIHRSPAVVCAVLCALGYPYKKAAKLLRKKRPIVVDSYFKDAEKAVAELGYC